jgi:hypothetical protein
VTVLVIILAGLALAETFNHHYSMAVANASNRMERM